MSVAWVAVGATVAGAAASYSAAGKAADAQKQAAKEGQQTQLHMFEEVQSLLEPYVNAGNSSLIAQQDLIGLNGKQAQETAISGINNSAQMQALTQSGEEAILQNASATGNLRSGNTKAALAQFRPQMLSQLIEQQYGKLGGLTSVGQNAAAGVGNAGMQTGANVANLQQQAGAAQAGAAVAQGNAIQQGIGGVANAIGAYQGYQQPIKSF